MRLLQRFTSFQEAERLAALLRERGVAARVTGHELSSVPVFYQSPGQAKLWILLDEQYRDAVALIRDPQHPVSRPLSSEQLALLGEDIHAQLRSRMVKQVVAAAVAGLVLCAALLLVFIKQAS